MGMKRYLSVALALAVGVSTAAIAGASTPRAQLKAAVCQTARDPANRGLSITAVMRPLPHTTRMAIRFQLLVRKRRGARQQVVQYGDLGTWIYPKDKTLGQRPGDRFQVIKPVAQLPFAPAFYRFKVSFRWTGAHNRVLGTTQRYSPTCFEPELRPDLEVSAIHVATEPKHPKRDIYSAVIRNTGASSSGQPVEVQFADGGATKTRTVAALGSHSKKVVSFVGPVCAAQAPPTVTVDPSGLIDDYNRTNNSLVATCPGP